MSKQSLKLEIFEKVTQLATAGLGLVAALAWNDAIQSLFKIIFGSQSEVWGKFLYAIIITGLIVLVTIKLGNVVDKVKTGVDSSEQK